MKFLSAHFILPIWILTLVLGFVEPALSQEPAKNIPHDDYSLQLPGADRLFRIQSEVDARKEIRDAALLRGEKKLAFPLDAQPLPKPVDITQTTPAQIVMLPMGRVCYRPLYYQDVRTQRYLQSWGVIEPLRSAFLFYGKTLILPGMLVAVPPWQYRCWDYPFVPTGK